MGVPKQLPLSRFPPPPEVRRQGLLAVLRTGAIPGGCSVKSRPATPGGVPYTKVAHQGDSQAGHLFRSRAKPCAIKRVQRLRWERWTGLEPATASLGSWSATIAPPPHFCVEQGTLGVRFCQAGIPDNRTECPHIKVSRRNCVTPQRGMLERGVQPPFEMSFQSHQTFTVFSVSNPIPPLSPQLLSFRDRCTFPPRGAESRTCGHAHSENV